MDADSIALLESLKNEIRAFIFSKHSANEENVFETTNEIIRYIDSKIDHMRGE